MSKRQSILFFNPDYHYSFLYKQELEKRGWDVKIFVPYNYPEHLLYEKNGFHEKKRCSILGGINDSFFLLRSSVRYKYFLFYGKIRLPFYMRKQFPFHRYFKRRCLFVEFAIMRLFGSKLIYLPSGCHDEFAKAQFELFDSRNVCNNCGFEDRCDDMANILNFNIINKYFSNSINLGLYDTPNYHSTVLRYKCTGFEPERVRRNIPHKYLLPESDAIRIMHATSLDTRGFRNRNIKGTPNIENAIQRLVKEGYNIEFHHLRNIPLVDMKYLQIQADIFIDQLIYGMWGSSAIEALTLEKTVVCYVRQDWKQHFLKNFGYQDLPFAESNEKNIYSVLKYLLDNPKELSKYQEKARDFSKQHYNVNRNVDEFINFLKNL